MRQKVKSISFEFESIGTKWIIDIFDGIPQKHRHTIQQKINDRVELFDRVYSRFRTDSIVYAMSQHGGRYILNDDLPPIMGLYRNLYECTDGLFTPLIGNVLDDLGYDAGYSFRLKRLRHPYRWEDAIEYHDANEIIIKQPSLLDFGAAGKGYLVDIIGRILEDHGIMSYCIDAGGDLLIKNTTIRVGLEHPKNPRQVIGHVDITNKSICASAGNRRAWGGYHHIIHPQTLCPVEDIIATWVIADQAMIADGIATALFFVKPEKILPLYSFEYVVIFRDYTYVTSEHCPVTLYHS
ncbi:MAG: FAD:protein FMN transferase [Patescibacteria group bacterium]|nr:FAD:protein FMN transferase [Patescibacteria group bacterium]